MTLDPLQQRGRERETEGERIGERVSWHANKQIYHKDTVNEEQLKKPPFW